MIRKEAQGCLTSATIPQGQLLRPPGFVYVVTGITCHVLVFLKVCFSICFCEGWSIICGFGNLSHILGHKSPWGQTELELDLDETLEAFNPLPFCY